MPLSVPYVGDGVVGDDVGSVGGGVVGTASVAAAASGERSEKESVIVLVTELAFAIPWLPVVLLKACVFGGGWSAVEGGGGL